MPNPPKIVAALLSIVICSLAHQCASYGTAKSREREALNVLLVPYAAPSHMMELATLGEELVSRGHNVTFCVTQLHKRYVSKGRELIKGTGMHFLTTSTSHYKPSMSTSQLSNLQLLSGMVKGKHIMMFSSRLDLISRLLVQTLDSPSMRHWDIIIGEDLLYPVTGTLARKWSVPIVHFANALDFQPKDLPFWSYPLYGTGSTDDLTFLQRLYSTIHLLMLRVVVNYLEATQLNSGGLADNRQDISPGIMTPFIVTTSFGFEYPRPLLPLFHYVGPMISNENRQSLNGPLKTWLDSKPNLSVVFISMGTTAKLSKAETTAITNGILATPYSALWSLRDPELHELVRNIAGHQNERRLFLTKWLPQQAVLRHSSIAMAILHGGMGGVQQSLYNGIPGVIIPFTQDQMDVAARVVSGGAGLMIHKREITAKRVAEAINTVSSSEYREAALIFRKTFLLSGGAKRTAELVEYYADVGYEHLVPAYAKYKWSFIQYYNVDVYALLLITSLLTIYGCLRVFKCWCMCHCKSRDFIKINPYINTRFFLLTVLVIAMYIIGCYMYCM